MGEIVVPWGVARDFAGASAIMLRRLLSHQVTRVVLTVAIIVSLLPSAEIQRLDRFFLLIFVPELIARLFLIVREEGRDELLRASVTLRHGWRKPSRAELLWVALDAVALLAFLPPEWILVGVSSARTLRLFRLVRLLLLFRLWAPMVVDLYTVLSRSERLKQVWLMTLASVLLSFAGAVVIEQVGEDAVDFDGDGEVGGASDATFLARLWWSFRQIEDPGNLMASPRESVVLLVSALLTVFGLFLVSFLIGLGTDVVRELMELSRLRAPGLSGHTVVVNITPATRQLLVELLQHYEKLAPEEWSVRSVEGIREIMTAARRRRQFLVVGTSEDPPDFMREPQFARVIYRQAPVHDDAIAMIRRTDMQRAKRVVMLADLYQREPDDATIRTLLNVVASMQGLPESIPRPRLIAEVVNGSSVGAARRATASYARSAHAHALTQLVTTESLVGLFLACAVRRPHSEEILSTLLTSEGWEIYTYSLDYPGGARTGDSEYVEDAEFRALHGVLSEAQRTDASAPVLLGSLVRAVTTEDENRADRSVRAVLGDAANDGGGAESARVGLVMLAPNFRRVREVMSDAMGAVQRASREERTIDRVGAAGEEPGLRDPGGPSLLTAAPASPASRVLVCGYRPGSVDLLESLSVAYPDATILFVVGSTMETMRRACDDLDAHRDAVLRRDVSVRGGTFETCEDPDLSSGDEQVHYRYVHRGEAAGVTEGARVVVARADWSSSRVLASLPGEFGAAIDMDAVVLCADESREGDARTLTALMKLEALFEGAWAAAPERSARARRLVVEVDDEDLATRLRNRFDRLEEQRVPGRDAPLSVSVYALPALRAYFMFQSVVVPHFDLVFEELLGPWGMSLSPLQIDPSVSPDAMISMGALDEAISALGGTVIGLEYEEEGRPALWVGRPEQGWGHEVRAGAISRVWGMLPDSMGTM